MAAPGTTQVTGIEAGVLVGYYDDAAASTHGFIATPKPTAVAGTVPATDAKK